MSDQNRYPTNAEEAAEFLDTLRFDDSAPEPELPGSGTPVLVSRTVRIPLDIDARLKAEAKRRGVPDAVVFREWLEIGMGSQSQNDDTLVRFGEVQRALEGVLSKLHPVQKRSA
ncbi:hypothetical protein [Nocardia sp. NPDC050793]|uniref:hypothetical protein n=1 Tax=Nocardia sp. NPDC050793 TaxID=3155159 RepID=UPI0033CD7022